MTATKPLEIPLPLKIKKEKDESMSSDDGDDPDADSDNSTSSLLLQPSILQNDCLSRIDPNDFLRLTSMVRRVYFSYLHKAIINNYNTCCGSIKGEKLSRGDLKKFSSLLELNAVRASIETSLYRQAILKLITDIKKDTVNNKINNKLAVYLDTPLKTVDVAVQTCFDELDHTQDNFSSIDCSNNDFDYSKQDINYSCPLLNGMEVSDDVISSDERLQRDGGMSKEETQNDGKELKSGSEIDESKLQDRINKNIIDVFGNSLSNIDGIDEDATCNEVDNIDEDTHDTLVQHLETMFGESDDSSDLMALIEKHSSVNKPSVEMEASKCVNLKINSLSNSNNNSNINNEGNNSNSCINNSSIIRNKLSDNKKLKENEFEVNEAGKRKVSFTDYKKLKKRSLEESKYEKEDKQIKKMRGVWLVERIHQVSKLKAKMMELWVRNHKKHERMKRKFQELFGEDEDEDEMMPESPINIEEHLNSCKERIAPWVVKYLMPFYEEKINGDKLLFKAVAKYVSDKLIIENTFPEEQDVKKYINDYFKNKTCIKTKAEIYF